SSFFRPIHTPGCMLFHLIRARRPPTISSTPLHIVRPGARVSEASRWLCPTAHRPTTRTAEHHMPNPTPIARWLAAAALLLLVAASLPAPPAPRTARPGDG